MIPSEDPSKAAHFQEINAFLNEAIAIVEMLRRPMFDHGFTSLFANTLSAHGLELTRRNLHRAAVIVVGRLWDEGPDARSIPTLWRHVSSERGFAELITRRRESAIAFELASSVPSDAAQRRRSADEVEEQARAEFEHLKRLIEDEAVSKLRRSTLVLRNRIAHAVVATRLERNAAKEGVVIERAKWGDLERIVRHSAEVAVGLAWITEDLEASYDRDWENWATYADHYWNSFSHPT